jgi:hypothetical protein
MLVKTSLAAPLISRRSTPGADAAWENEVLTQDTGSAARALES